MKKTLYLPVAIILVAGSASAQSGNEARGERLFNQQCKACHTLEKDGASPAGPESGRKRRESIVRGGSGSDSRPVVFLPEPRSHETHPTLASKVDGADEFHHP